MVSGFLNYAIALFYFVSIYTTYNFILYTNYKWLEENFIEVEDLW